MALKPNSLRLLRDRLILLLILYFVAGNVSQKLIPGVDEIFPFFGWSLFSSVPNEDQRFTILIEEHNGQVLEPPVLFLQAPDTIVTGNRYVGRKVIDKMGRAKKRERGRKVKKYRSLLETNYLRGQVRYELVYERYDPLEKWKTGESRELESLGRYETGKAR
ncbi:MAG: hypothetical protein P8Y44_11745 [Acidobacteriota bacterium]